MRIWQTAGLVMALALSAKAQDSTRARSASGEVAPTKKPRILGVYDVESGSPVSGAQVRDTLGNFMMTSITGTVPVGFMTPIGNLLLGEVKKIGYKPVALKLLASDSADVTIVFERVTELPAVVTSEKFRLDLDEGRREGFERRCGSRLVTCFRDQELSARPSAQLFDFLVKADGVIPDCSGSSLAEGQRIAPGQRISSVRGSSSQSCLIKMHSNSGPGKCEPAYFLDGFKFEAKRSALLELEQAFGPQAVMGMEVFPSGQPRPLRFEGGSTCGAIAIWTK